MFPHIVLIFGIALVAAAVGYMAGGSATPVASVAIPAVFGLAVTALGLLQAAQPSKDLLDFIQVQGKDADTQPDIVQYRQRVRSAPTRVGVALAVFSVCYLAAATYGARVRVENVLVPKQAAKAFPWKSADRQPPTIAASLEWIALQSRLIDLGYSEAQITALYDIQRSEWRAAATSAAASLNKDKDVAMKGVDSPGAKKPELPANDAFWRDYLKQGGPKVAPFANQPPKELIDKLNGAGGPGRPSSVSLPS